MADTGKISAGGSGSGSVGLSGSGTGGASVGSGFAAWLGVPPTISSVVVVTATAPWMSGGGGTGGGTKAGSGKLSVSGSGSGSAGLAGGSKSSTGGAKSGGAGVGGAFVAWLQVVPEIPSHVTVTATVPWMGGAGGGGIKASGGAGASTGAKGGVSVGKSSGSGSGSSKTSSKGSSAKGSSAVGSGASAKGGASGSKGVSGGGTLGGSAFVTWLGIPAVIPSPVMDMSALISSVMAGVAAVIAAFTTMAAQAQAATATMSKAVQTEFSAMFTAVTQIMDTMAQKVIDDIGQMQDSFDSLDTSSAVSAVEDLKSAIDSLKSKTVTVSVKVKGGGTKGGQSGHSGIVSEETPFTIGEHGFPEFFYVRQLYGHSIKRDEGGDTIPLKDRIRAKIQAVKQQIQSHTQFPIVPAIFKVVLPDGRPLAYATSPNIFRHLGAHKGSAW